MYRWCWWLTLRADLPFVIDARTERIVRALVVNLRLGEGHGFFLKKLSCLYGRSVQHFSDFIILPWAADLNVYIRSECVHQTANSRRSVFLWLSRVRYAQRQSTFFTHPCSSFNCLVSSANLGIFGSNMQCIKLGNETGSHRGFAKCVCRRRGNTVYKKCTHLLKPTIRFTRTEETFKWFCVFSVTFDYCKGRRAITQQLVEAAT